MVKQKEGKGKHDLWIMGPSLPMGRLEATENSTPAYTRHKGGTVCHMPHTGGLDNQCPEAQHARQLHAVEDAPGGGRG